MTSSGVPDVLPKAMLSCTLRANSGLSCITMLIWERRDSIVYERISLPSIRILPSQGSWRRNNRLAMVDLAARGANKYHLLAWLDLQTDIQEGHSLRFVFERHD